MKRLREIEPRTRLLRHAQSLLDAAEPSPESRERMLRVRRALDRPAPARARRLPALVLGAAVVFFGASAFAAVRIFDVIERWVAPAWQAPADSSEAARAHRARRHALAPAAAQPPVATAPVANGAAEAQPSPPAAPQIAAPIANGSAPSTEAARSHAPSGTKRPAHTDATARSPAHHAPVQAREQEPPAAQPAQAPAAAAPADSEFVHRAVKALRRDNDPAAAARLLDWHRAHSPDDDPLAEEALSLQIEAALALGEPRARTLAREYLERYPGGRYTAVAQRALAGDDP
jgi:hypothetical protein